MIKKFAQAAGCSRSPGLFPIHVIHRLIHEQTECEAEVEPRWSLNVKSLAFIQIPTAQFRDANALLTYRPYQIWHEYNHQCDIHQNKAKP